MPELSDYLETRLQDQPTASGPGIETLRRRATARRRRQQAFIGLGAAGAATATLMLAAQLAAPDASSPPTEFAAPTDAPAADDGRRGEVALEGTFSCVEQYSASAIPTRGFAFDGVVTAVDEQVSGSDTTSMGGDLWQVSFEVEEWFAGGEGDTATVTLFRPQPASDGRPPAYGVGTRLLVSGETQTGGADYLAWACGFTRYYDPQTAGDWRAATS